jgi:hypothetical protein
VTVTVTTWSAPLSRIESVIGNLKIMVSAGNGSVLLHFGRCCKKASITLGAAMTDLEHPVM